MKKVIVLVSVFLVFGVLFFSNYFDVFGFSSPVFTGESFSEWQDALKSSGFSNVLERITSALLPLEEDPSLLGESLRRIVDTLTELASLVNNFTASQDVPVWDVIGSFIMLIVEVFVGAIGTIHFLVSASLALLGLPFNLFNVVW